jgi:MFS transporter, DHA1 family, multidrug resistance protein
MVILITIFLGFGIIIPIMPEVITGANAGTFHMGMMLAVYSAVSFLMSPYWGALSDRIGRRPVIMTGVLGFSISFFIFGMAGDNLVLMYISRILGGLFSGATTACAVAYVADVTSEENRTKGMGLVGMSIGLGFIFGPALGGLLSGFGYAVPFFVAAALSLVTLLVAYFQLPESLTQKDRDEVRARTDKRSRWTAFSGSLKYLYILSFFVSFTLAGLESTLQFFEMARFGATPADMGIMFLVSGIAGAAIQGGVVRRLVKKGDEPRVVVIGLILSAAGFFALMFSYNLLTATVYLTIFASGNALIRPCVTSLITQKTKVGQGVATGLNSSMDSLGRIAGPLLATGIFNVRIDLPFAIGGVLSLAALLLVLRFTTMDRRSKGTASMA